MLREAYPNTKARCYFDEIHLFVYPSYSLLQTCWLCYPARSNVAKLAADIAAADNQPLSQRIYALQRFMNTVAPLLLTTYHLLFTTMRGTPDPIRKPGG